MDSIYGAIPCPGVGLGCGLDFRAPTTDRRCLFVWKTDANLLRPTRMVDFAHPTPSTIASIAISIAASSKLERCDEYWVIHASQP